MEFYEELLLTAAVSVLLVLLLGKIVTVAVGGAEVSELLLSARHHVRRDAGSEEEKAGEEFKEESSDAVDGEEGKTAVGLYGERVVYEETRTVEEEEEAEEEEWEGIERSELEKLFGAATAYTGSADGGVALARLSSDVRTRLYGLRKVATEGPCYELLPMALKFSARAKWHAWHRLGNMTPEVAMEQYITLLSESIPGWMGVKHGDERDDLPKEGVYGTESSSDLKFTLHSQLASENKGEPEDTSW